MLALNDKTVSNTTDYKLKTFNKGTLDTKLDIIRSIKGEVIDLIYFNMLKNLKNSLNSECLKKGRDVISDFSYDIEVSNYVLSIPLYNINAVRVKYSEGVKPLVMPVCVLPIKESIYTDLDRYESVVSDKFTLKGFLGVYSGSKVSGFFMYMCKKDKALSYVEGKIFNITKAINKYDDYIKSYEDRVCKYYNRLDENKSFLNNIEDDLMYLREKGFKIDIML